MPKSKKIQRNSKKNQSTLLITKLKNLSKLSRGLLFVAIFAVVGGSVILLAQALNNNKLQLSSANAALYFHLIKDTPEWEKNSLPLIGKPRLVITRAQGTEDAERFAIKKIHETGGLAYRYLQYFWFPDNKADPDTGLNISQNPDWIYCRQGNTPLFGVRFEGVKSYFLDLNERAARDNMIAFYKKIKDWGYDGVFVDIGRGARSGRTDYPLADQLIPGEPSTCTKDPIVANRSFADSYIETITQAKALGLKTILNYDRAHVPGKKLPANWYNYLDWTLDESVNNSNIPWQEIYDSNRYAELDGQGKTIQLIKEDIKDANGKPITNKDDVYFRSSRARLFSSPIAVNSLNSRLYPELTSATLNGPFVAGPFTISCDDTATGQCLWARRYSGGLVIVNNTNQNKSTKNIWLGTQSCRTVKNLYSGQLLDGGACITSLDLSIPAKSGRIFLYNVLNL